MNKREKKEYIISNYNGEQLQEYVDKLKKIDDTFTYASIRYFLIKGKEEGRIKEIIKGNKNSKKTQMIIDYYKENYPQKNFREIGEHFGLSKQRINQIIKKAKEQQITHG